LKNIAAENLRGKQFFGIGYERFPVGYKKLVS
jgi:hypothetical protein